MNAPRIRTHSTDGAPRAIGPYVQSVSAAGFLFASGQIGLDPATGELVPGGFAAEVRRAFANLEAVLGSAGCGFADVTKVTVFLADMDDFSELNAVYSEAFGAHRPARSTVPC